MNGQSSHRDTQAEGFFRTLVENVPEAIIVSTPEGEIT